ncbi:hypothetical protein JQS43_19165 [Natronosporangium hydrolyticum]|uniref:Uncharacterized protein n=1 Tax=Natronosporangium hydrolyticum TaxID=2811111 RepID=A0A895Y7I3_9ACTN|nr:hypothetical protein [Natronosporangium hydrolyticum]QSB13677.1 hypothetical protein JQS43_19165 [Natronosporangium hydrolyticum]
MIIVQPRSPFERHPALPALLEGEAGGLVRLAEEATDHETLTDRAFDPAVAAWDGLAAEELQAAPEDLRAAARDVASKVAWAAVPLLTWAEHVREFNRQVDQLLEQLGQVPVDLERRLHAKYADFDEQPDMLRELLRKSERDLMIHELEEEWHRVFTVHVDEGARDVAGMLRTAQPGRISNWRGSWVRSRRVP